MTRPVFTVPDEVDLWAWNAYLGCSPRRLRETLNTSALRPRRPHVIVLNEVPYLYDELADWCRSHGYGHHQEAMGDRKATVVEEQGSTAVLLDQRRDGLGLIDRRVAVMRLTWLVFSKKRRHRPRRYEVVRLATPGGVWAIRGSHWPTAGNVAALAESMTRAAAWFTRRRPGVVAVDVGDHNRSVRALRAWARLFGGRVAGYGVDSAIVTGATVRAEQLGKFGSDHPAIRYTLTRKEKR